MTAQRLRVAAAVAWCGAAGAPRTASAIPNDGTTALSFLEYPQGARAAGMGGAFSAVADDVSSLWWNPAGLAQTKRTEISVTHTSFVEDIKTQYFALSRPIASLRGTVGGSLSYLNIPGIEGTDSTGGSGPKLTANSYALSVAYATFIVPGQVTAGASLKRIGQKLADESASGFALDLGAQAKQEKFGAGIVLQNLGPSFKLGNDSSPLPLTIRAGASYELSPRLVSALDISKPRDGSARPHFGTEFRASNNLHLRVGWEKQEYVGAGAGLAFGFSAMGGFGGGSADSWAGDGTPWWNRAATGLQWSIDYAFQSLGDLKEVHHLSFSAKF